MIIKRVKIGILFLYVTNVLIPSSNSNLFHSTILITDKLEIFIYILDSFIISKWSSVFFHKYCTKVMRTNRKILFSILNKKKTTIKIDILEIPLI